MVQNDRLITFASKKVKKVSEKSEKKYFIKLYYC